MSKPDHKRAVLIAAVALATATGAQATDNWTSTDGATVWKNGSNELCWRNAFWTPATAAANCDGAIVPKKEEPAPKPVVPVTPPVVEPPVVPPPVVVPTTPEPVAAAKVSYSAGALFDFDKSVLKPEGKAQLDDLVGKIKDVTLEVIIAVGHTDSIGTDAYNQRLSIRRAEAVKAYLVSKGVDKNRVYTEGKGEKQPVADNKTRAGRAKNRRVEIEVVGTRAAK